MTRRRVRLSAMGIGVLLIGFALAAFFAPMHDETSHVTSSCGTLLHPKDGCDRSSETYRDQVTSVVLLSLAGSMSLAYSVVARPRDRAPRGV